MAPSQTVSPNSILQSRIIPAVDYAARAFQGTYTDAVVRTTGIFRGKEEATTDSLDVKGNSVTCTNNHHTISHDPVITATSRGTQGFRKGYQYAQHPTCIPSPKPTISSRCPTSLECKMQCNASKSVHTPQVHFLYKKV